MTSGKISPFLAEALVWVFALVYLAVLPFENLPSFCIFKMMGFSRCPGCGLGHAIHYALVGDFIGSLKAHILGVPALLLIVWRIIKLFGFHARLIKTER